MRAMIVDDEPLARRELGRLLAEFACIDIVGEAANVGEAALLIEKLLPELLFLDIQMPGGTGFDLLERLEHLPRVVFTTAYDEHAVRAFEVTRWTTCSSPSTPSALPPPWLAPRPLRRAPPQPRQPAALSSNGCSCVTVIGAGSCRCAR
jgi:two-component system, LytTR family, response regulator